MAHRKLAGLALATLTLPFLSGCIATTAVGLAAETVEAGVEITGAVIGTGVDLVTTSGKKSKEKGKVRVNNVVDK